MHVNAGDRETVVVGAAETIVELLVPDAVLRLLAARVCLLAVPVAKTGVDSQRDISPGGSLAKLVDHFRRAAVDGQSQLDDSFQRFAIENVGRIDDFRMVCVSNFVARFQSPMYLACTDSIHNHAVSPHEVQNGNVRARLLGIPYDVKLLQIIDALDNLGRVIDIRWRAEMLGERGDANAGDLRSDRLIWLCGGHVVILCFWALVLVSIMPDSFGGRPS